MTDIGAHTAGRRALIGELRRLAYAREDIAIARDGCRLLEEGPDYLGMQSGRGVWAMWAGIVSSYCRPFTNGKLRLDDSRWQTFDDERLQVRHDRLQTLRDKLFAHNDVREEREVVVTPPGAFIETGDAKLQQAVFYREDAIETGRLCVFQIERMGARIQHLVEVICADRAFSEGTMLTLDDLLKLG